MKHICYCILLSAIVMLSGCIKVNVNPSNNPTFPACKMMCDQQAAACRKVCRNNCPNCCKFANKLADKRYCSYRHEEIIKGGFIVRRLKSYRDPLQCRKVTCNCTADYNICIQACGGTVHKQLKALKPC